MSNDEFYEALRQWRNKVAAAHSKKPFQILSNAVLRRIADQRPNTWSGLDKVKGIGPCKMTAYGNTLLKAIQGDRT